MIGEQGKVLGILLERGAQKSNLTSDHAANWQKIFEVAISIISIVAQLLKDGLEKEDVNFHSTTESEAS
jgi:hypothetical protein